MNKNETVVGLVLVLLAALISYVIFVRPHDVPAPAPLLPKIIPVPAPKLQLIYATSRNCIWCDRMERNTLSHARVQERLAKEFTFLKVSGKDTIDRYGVKSYPSYLILTPDGKELRRGVGYRSPEEFLAWLDGANAGDAAGFTEAKE